MHPNTERLHRLMADYGVNGPFVADLLGRAVKTVHCWRSQSPAPISDEMLELLEYKLRDALGDDGRVCRKDLFVRAQAALLQLTESGASPEQCEAALQMLLSLGAFTRQQERQLTSVCAMLQSGKRAFVQPGASAEIK